MPYLILKRIVNWFFTIDKQNLADRDVIITAFKDQGIRVEERKMELEENNVIITIEVILKDGKLEWLQDYLLKHPKVNSFAL